MTTSSDTPPPDQPPDPDDAAWTRLGEVVKGAVSEALAAAAPPDEPGPDDKPDDKPGPDDKPDDKPPTDRGPGPLARLFGVKQ